MKFSFLNIIILIFTVTNIYLFIVLYKPFEFSFSLPILVLNKDIYRLVIPLILNIFLFVTTVYCLTVKLIKKFELFYTSRMILCYINLSVGYVWIIIFLGFLIGA
jgi:hypothetical protein